MIEITFKISILSTGILKSIQYHISKYGIPTYKPPYPLYRPILQSHPLQPYHYKPTPYIAYIYYYPNIIHLLLPHTIPLLLPLHYTPTTTPYHTPTTTLTPHAYYYPIPYPYYYPYITRLLLPHTIPLLLPLHHTPTTTPYHTPYPYYYPIPLLLPLHHMPTTTPYHTPTTTPTPYAYYYPIPYHYYYPYTTRLLLPHTIPLHHTPTITPYHTPTTIPYPYYYPYTIRLLLPHTIPLLLSLHHTHNTLPQSQILLPDRQLTNDAINRELFVSLRAMNKYTINNCTRPMTSECRSVVFTLSTF